jgi:hypothetical protein
VAADKFDLGAEFPLDLIEAPLVFRDRATGIIFIGPQHRKKETVGVDEAWARGERPPLYVVPFAREREMHADIDAGVGRLREQAHGFGKPRRRGDDLDRSRNALAVTLDQRRIAAVRETHVVGAHDQANGAGPRFGGAQRWDPSRGGGGANTGDEMAAGRGHAMSWSTTWPETSVSRKSRPLCL